MSDSFACLSARPKGAGIRACISEPTLSLSVVIAMPGTRTTQNVGPILGSCYPVDVALVADEVNLWERNAKRSIVYKRSSAKDQGKFEAVISDAEGNEHGVIVGPAR